MHPPIAQLGLPFAVHRCLQRRRAIGGVHNFAEFAREAGISSEQLARSAVSWPGAWRTAMAMRPLIEAGRAARPVTER